MGVDHYSKEEMLGLGFSFLTLPCIFVALRVWAKVQSRRRLSWDDYLIFVALAFSIACSALQIVATLEGELGQHQTVGPNGQPLLNNPRFITYEKCKFASQILAVVGMGFTKASLLVFFRGIFQVSKTFQRASSTMLFVVFGWTLSFFFSNLFTCSPVTPFVEPFYGHRCINSIAMWYSSCVTDVAVDLVILILPLPPVMKLQMPLRKKLAVAGIFFMGTTVVAISITRMIMYIHVGTTIATHTNDETYYTSPVFFWTNIEISLGVILPCLPILRNLGIFRSSQIRLAPYKYHRSESSGNSGQKKRVPDASLFATELDTLQLVPESAQPVTTTMHVKSAGEGGDVHGHQSGNDGLTIAVKRHYSWHSSYEQERS